MSRPRSLAGAALALAAMAAACGGVAGRLERSIARGAHTEAVGRAQSWLERHDATHEQTDEVLTLLERARFEEARSLDDVSTYRQFLADYPGSELAPDVLPHLARVQFETHTRIVDTMAEYHAFLEEFPDGEHSELARLRLARLAWRAANLDNTLGAYEEYARTYSDHAEADAAEAKLRGLQWQSAAADGGVDALLAYVAEFPDDPASPAVARYAEAMEWDTAREHDSAQSYARFRRLFPDSANAEEALQLEMARAWRDAERAETEASYRSYVQAYPGSARAGLAEERAAGWALFHGSVSDDELFTTISQIDDRDAEQVTLYVDVRDHNQVLVSGLLARDMLVYDNGRRAEVIDVVGMERNRPVDIVFVIDVSPSMSDKIDAVRNSVVAFAQTLRNRQRDVRFGLVTYLEETRVHDRGRLTDEPAEFQQWVSRIGIENGSIENPARALYEAGRMSFRRDAQHVVILLTDEDPNVAFDPETELTTAASAMRLSDAGVSLFLMVTRSTEYDAIAEVAGAASYDITRSSYDGFRQMLLSVADRLSLQYQVHYRDPEPERAGRRRARVRVFKPSLWLPASTLPEDRVVAFLVDPDDGCRALAVMHRAGIFRTLDCAGSWERVAGAELTIEMALGNYGPDHILYLLTEDGRLWTLSGLDGAPLQRDIALPDIEAIAWVQSRSHEVWTVSDGTLHVSYENALGFEPYAAVPSEVIARSLTPDPVTSGRLCGVDRSGGFWCVGGSRQWTRLSAFHSTGRGAQLSMCPWRAGVYLIVVDGVLYRSLDGGNVWLPVSLGVPVTSSRAFWGTTAGTGTVCVDTERGTACSVDDGTTWRWVGGPGGALDGFIAFRPSGGMYTVSGDGGFVARTGEMASREFLGSALFAVDESEPYSNALPLIEQIGRTLANDSSLRALVEGHTDSDGDDDYNMDLSERRANSVAYLLSRAGASRDQLEATGRGETQPILPNDSDENKQANRRVEITIYREY